MYADAFGLLVFEVLVTSASLSKNKFFDRLNRLRKQAVDLLLNHGTNGSALRIGQCVEVGRSGRQRLPLDVTAFMATMVSMLNTLCSPNLNILRRSSSTGDSSGLSYTRKPQYCSCRFLQALYCNHP